MTSLPKVWDTMAQMSLGNVGAAGGCFIVDGCSQAASRVSSSSRLFSIPPLLSHSILLIASFSDCQAPGPASPMGTRTTPRPPIDARAQGCGAAVPAKPRIPSVRVLSCVGDLRSGKQKLHVSTGWGGKAISLRASISGRWGDFACDPRGPEHWLGSGSLRRRKQAKATKKQQNMAQRQSPRVQ